MWRARHNVDHSPESQLHPHRRRQQHGDQAGQPSNAEGGLFRRRCRGRQRPDLHCPPWRKKLVYDVGVGFEPAQGVDRSDAPALKSWQVGSFVKSARADLVHRELHTVQEETKFHLIPAILGSLRKQSDVSERSKAGTPA